MPNYVKINVEDHLLIDNSKTVEDITSVVLPQFEHPTTAVNVSGMAMDVDMPNSTHYNAAEIQVAHNNGANCNELSKPGRHVMEFRTVRQKYTTSQMNIGHESVKYRVTAMLKSVEKGTIETGNPWGSTNRYSVLRYEEIVDGKRTMLVDAGGTIEHDGVNYTDDVQALLK